MFPPSSKGFIHILKVSSTYYLFHLIRQKQRQYIRDFNLQLKTLETKIDNGEDVVTIYNAVCKELEEIEKETLRGSIIRSRAQLVEENEKCSKHFMNLEKRNYKSKSFTTLMKDKHSVNKESEMISASVSIASINEFDCKCIMVIYANTC
jgi:hypothetical protein